VPVNVTEPGAELPAFAAPATFATGDAPDEVTAADLNGDGRPDLATGNGLAGSVNALLNTTPLPLTAGPSSLAFGSQPLGTIGAPKR
jgi:FG-GAP repeat